MLPAGAAAAASPSRESRGQLRIILRELRRNRGAVGGGIILGVLIVIALLAPVIAPHDPIKVVSRASLLAPSVGHPFGTDRYGRDILSRLIFGTRISLMVGVISVGIGASAGIPLGLTAAWAGGWVDALFTRMTDAMLAMPGILLALSVITVLGPGLNNAMIAVGVASIPSYVRLVRGSVLSAKENVYIESARAIGCSGPRIMNRHVLPNVIAPVIVLASLGTATAILSAASLSFLGLGAQPPTPEWGAAVSEGRDFLDSAWWISTFPSLAIMITVLSINMLGDGLRDALDPRLRGR